MKGLIKAPLLIQGASNAVLDILFVILTLLKIRQHLRKFALDYIHIDETLV